MIRNKHNIDTQLINFFLTKSHFDNSVNESLINWYSSLGEKEHQITRENAITFLKKLALAVLGEIDYPPEEREELLRIFEPLELLLRTALSLKNPNEKTHFVRDHLSHTVRNVLFTNYLLEKYYPTNNSSIKRQLFIAVIFHDLAYPIEKIKKVAKKLSDATFQNLLNSKGEIEIELNNPDDLLEMLDFVKNAQKVYEKKINRLNKKIEEDIGKVNIEKNSGELSNAKLTLKKVEHIYREVISKAIAGKGLFDASHSISSVVLFLSPIIKYWKESKQYQEINLDKITDICLAMTYHDRGNYIQLIKGFPIPGIVKLMRIADELQEWDREYNSYIKDVEMVNDIGAILSLRIIMKDKSADDICKPELFIPDKVNGLYPVIDGDEVIKLRIEFPNTIDKEKLGKEMSKMEETLNRYSLKVNYKMELKERNVITLTFNNSLVNIT